MNLVGKIFVVAIFVMSIVWMGFAMAVYTAQKSWKEEIERPQNQVTAGKQLGWKFRLENAQKENDDSKLQIAALEKQLADVKDAEAQQRAKLETRLQEQKTQREALQQQVTDLEEKSRNQIAAVTAAQANLSNLTEQAATLRAELLTTLQKRDEGFVTVVNTTEDLHNQYAEVKSLKERVLQLSAQIDFYRQKLTDAGVKDLDAPIAGAAPPLDGVVTAIKNNDLVEVSIGSDEGLKVGHILHVYRAGRAYLGRVQIIETSPDRSAGKILRDSRTGVIQKGDRVATSLKVS